MTTFWRKMSLWFAIFLVVVGAGWFCWRVITFARLIRSGEITSFDQVYARTALDARALESLAQGAPGTGNLAGGEGEPTLGDAHAPVTVVEYADFGCPYSAEASYVVRALAQQYPDTVRVVYRNYPLDVLHEGATDAAVAAECADEQGKFWEYHDGLFRLKGDFTEESLFSLAQSAGLQTVSWQRCLTQGTARDRVETDIADGLTAGVRSTPTFFINGLKVEGSIPYAIFRTILEEFARK